MRFSVFGQPVSKLRRVIGPSEVLVLAASPTLLVDLTDVGNANAVVSIFNNHASASIFYCFHTSGSGAPSLTTANGTPLFAQGSMIIDSCGGIAIWAIAAADQVSGAGTRVTGTKI